MFKHNKRALQATLLCAALLNLTGCMSAIKHLDRSGKQEAGLQSSGSMSVEELLSKVRDQNPQSTPDQNLYLKFESTHKQLNPAQEQNLLNFAALHKATLKLACAPSNHEDKFISASIGIKRCQNIHQFLRSYTFKSEIILAPDLFPDQVRVHL